MTNRLTPMTHEQVLAWLNKLEIENKFAKEFVSSYFFICKGLLKLLQEKKDPKDLQSLIDVNNLYESMAKKMRITTLNKSFKMVKDFLKQND